MSPAAAKGLTWASDSHEEARLLPNLHSISICILDGDDAPSVIEMLKSRTSKRLPPHLTKLKVVSVDEASAEHIRQLGGSRE